jgi:hypothetical protein
MIRVFVGIDYREMVSAHVLMHSIMARTSEPVALCPITVGSLPKAFTRKRDSLATNEFSDLRFLVPYFSGYEGWSIFMDCDMLCRADIAQLWAQRNSRYSVMCVKHDHRPAEQTKYLGTKQTQYPKKNWSSVMLFNNPACRVLTPAYISNASGLDLHRFNWLESEQQIGDLPQSWNHLVGYLPYEESANLVHWTIGGPWFHEYADANYAAEWHNERDAMLHAQQVFYPNRGKFARPE